MIFVFTRSNVTFSPALLGYLRESFFPLSLLLFFLPTYYVQYNSYILTHLYILLRLSTLTASLYSFSTCSYHTARDGFLYIHISMSAYAARVADYHTALITSTL